MYSSCYMIFFCNHLQWPNLNLHWITGRFTKAFSSILQNAQVCFPQLFKRGLAKSALWWDLDFIFLWLHILWGLKQGAAAWCPAQTETRTNSIPKEAGLHNLQLHQSEQRPHRKVNGLMRSRLVEDPLQSSIHIRATRWRLSSYIGIVLPSCCPCCLKKKKINRHSERSERALWARETAHHQMDEKKREEEEGGK